MLSRNKYLNNYKIIIKKTIVEKEDNFYFNNIKFNYFRKDNHKNLSTKNHYLLNKHLFYLHKYFFLFLKYLIYIFI